MGIISIPKALRNKLGEDGAEALVDVLNMQGEENKQSVIDLAEQRFEKKLSEELGTLRTGFETKLSLLREHMVAGDDGMRIELHKTRADMIKWMFIFWVGQIGFFIGLFFAFYKAIT